MVLAIPNRTGAGSSDVVNIYLDALAQEKDRFENCLNVHDLPAIFHYWSQTGIYAQS